MHPGKGPTRTERMRARTMNRNLLQTRGEILHIDTREPATQTESSSKNELPAQHSSIRTIQACPRGRGAQTIGIDTATDMGTAGTQKDIKTETGAPADLGLRSKHGVEVGAQTGMDTETLCAAREGGSRTQKDIETETGAPADLGLRSKHGVEVGAQTGMDTETLCAAGEGGSRTQKDIETETGTRTDHGSKRGEEAGARTGMDTATDWRAGGTQRDIERGTGAGAGALARTAVPVDSRMATLRLKR